MSNEGSLKTKWRRHAEERGFWTKSLSPHQIPGLPDLLVIDKSASDTIRGMRRTRQHQVEAKIARIGPRTKFVFDASRDATPLQQVWMRQMAAMGASAWWLVLDKGFWLLVPATTLLVPRFTWNKSKCAYGTRIIELEEPETNRKKAVAAMDRILATIKTKVVRGH